MNPIAFITGQNFVFAGEDEVFVFSSVRHIDGKCFVFFRKQSSPSRLLRRQVDGLWDLEHVR